MQVDTDDDDLDWARLREWAHRDDPTDYAVMYKSNVVELFAAVDEAMDWIEHVGEQLARVVKRRRSAA